LRFRVTRVTDGTRSSASQSRRITTARNVARACVVVGVVIVVTAVGANRGVDAREEGVARSSR
jgi:hypothetical protein